MSLQRGDVVIIDFPMEPGTPSKRRPAVVVQSDRNNSRLSTSIFAMVSSNLRLAGQEPTQVLIDVSTTDGQSTGIVKSSVIKCENLYTLPQSLVLRTIGRLSQPLQFQVNLAIKASLAVQ